MPVMQLVPFFMHINLKRTSKWILKFLRIFFERDTEGKNPPVLLCSIPSNQMHEQQYHSKVSNSYVFLHFFFELVAAVFSRLKPALKIFCELRFGPHQYHIMAILLNQLKLWFKRAFSFLPVNFVTMIRLFLDLQLL